MAQKEMNPLAVSAFCESMAMMLQSGISPDEAAGLLAEDSCENDFHAAALAVQKPLLLGDTLASAMEQSGFFPPYCCQMVAAGEKAGRTESVLRSLSRYYESRDRMNRKLRSAVVYPMVLLLIMAAILAVLLAAVLPVFTGVYENLTGGVGSSSFAYIQVSQIVGWVALVVTLVLGVGLLIGAGLSRSPKRAGDFVPLFRKVPLDGVGFGKTGRQPVYRCFVDFSSQRAGYRYQHGSGGRYGQPPRRAEKTGSLPGGYGKWQGVIDSDLRTPGV